MTFPWISAAFLALTIGLALIARKPREFDISRFPRQVQQSGLGGMILSSVALFMFAAEFAWWYPVPVVGAGVALWFLTSLLPRFARLVLEVISILAWPFSLIVGSLAMAGFAEQVG